MGNARVVVLVVASLLPLTAHTLSSPESKRTARIVDEATGQPVATVFFAVEQHHRVPTPIHGSSSTCVREGAAIGRDGQAELTLPTAEIDALSRLRGESSERSFAHSPGYCTLPEWNTQGGHSVFRARRNVDPPEQRILYLRQVARSLPKGCRGASAEGAEATRKAIAAELVAEARSAASTPYEHYLLEQMNEFIIGSPAQDPPALSRRGFAIVDESNPQPIGWNQANTSCRLTGSRIYPERFGATVPPPPRYRVVCRDPADCEFERRRANGRTYLAELIECVDPDRVAVLLAAGADPDARRYPGGPSGLDSLLGIARQVDGNAFPKALATLKLLAADGRATVRPETRAAWRELAQTAAPASRESYADIVALLERLPDRPRFTPACPLRGEVDPDLR